jgi:hypothetical protein
VEKPEHRSCTLDQANRSPSARQLSAHAPLPKCDEPRTAVTAGSQRELQTGHQVDAGQPVEDLPCR